MYDEKKKKERKVSEDESFVVNFLIFIYTLSSYLPWIFLIWKFNVTNGGNGGGKKRSKSRRDVLKLKTNGWKWMNYFSAILCEHDW